MMHTFWAAVGFLTTLPVPRHDLLPDGLHRAARWFPTIGLLLGVILAGSAWAFAWLFPPTVTAVLVVGLWAGLTGALHLDGVADCGDGLLPPLARTRRLEIMRDPRLGAFGVTALVLILLLKTAALAALALMRPALAPALLLAPIWARWLILLAARLPAARAEGMGASLGPTLSNRQLAFAALLPVVLTAVMGIGHWPVILATGAAILAGLGVLHLAQQRLGGVTGDVFGAVVEVSEAVFLCVACLRVASG
ncbi:MAG: adenosylcobinamide-GDP ribazoletransferase [Caldilinea sp.]|nr:adenosylcobinamide-GDP ribazoletransferase [Anaerolineales bacterium]HRA64554.1 adenosylcobinamide-GDP ribazoletransferase [Caldilinea sp.]